MSSYSIYEFFSDFFETGAISNFMSDLGMILHYGSIPMFLTFLFTFSFIVYVIRRIFFSG